MRLAAIIQNVGVAICVAILASANAAGSGVTNVIYVDDDAPVGGDGSSWTNAFRDLQQALTSASGGDEIRIAKGRYTPAPPNGSRMATFTIPDGVSLRGGYAGIDTRDPDANDPLAYPTTLSGDLNGDDAPNFVNDSENSYNVVTAEFVHFIALRGLTISGGNATIPPSGPCGSGGTPYSEGGGAIIRADTFFMEDCVVRGNRAWCGGGGMIVRGGSAEFRRCTFESNRASGGDTTYGGAVSCTARSSFIQCRFLNNHASWYCGGLWASTAGTYLRSCEFRNNYGGEAAAALSGFYMEVADCDFDLSSSSHWVSNVSCAFSTIVNCRFTRSSASICSTASGAALRISGACVVANSYFAGSNGGIATVGISGPENTIENCTIVGNRACSAAVHVMTGGNLQLRNSVIWGNLGTNSPPAEFVQLLNSGTINVQNCCIQNWTGTLGGSGNHGNDPRFIDANGFDDLYGTIDDNPRLKANSPLIDRSDPNMLPRDSFDLDDDGDIEEPLPIDLGAQNRVIGRLVDVGGYEFQGVPCLADINGSGAVDVAELLAVLGAWGACPAAQTCNADLNLSGAVDVADLLFVIRNWGSCPL